MKLDNPILALLFVLALAIAVACFLARELSRDAARELAELQRRPRPTGRGEQALPPLPPSAWTTERPTPPVRHITALLVTRQVRPQLDEIVAGQKWRNN